MNDDPTKRDLDHEAPTRAGGDDLEFELESPTGKSPDQGAQLPVPRQGFLSRIFRRRDPTTTAQAGFAEMMGVMHAIKGNLEVQTDSQARLLEALEKFPEAVDGLKGLGKMGEHQEEMLTLVRKQVDASAEQGRQVVGSFKRFDQTLQGMGETSRSTAETMIGVAERSREAEDILRTMLERSERRLTFLFGIVGLLCIAVIGGALFLSAGGRLDLKLPPGDPPDEAVAEDAFEGPPMGEAGAGGTEDADASSTVTGEAAMVVVPLDAEFSNTVAADTETGPAADVIVPLDVERTNTVTMGIETGEAAVLIVPLDEEVTNTLTNGADPSVEE